MRAEGGYKAAARQKRRKPGLVVRAFKAPRGRAVSEGCIARFAALVQKAAGVPWSSTSRSESLVVRGLHAASWFLFAHLVIADSATAGTNAPTASGVIRSGVRERRFSARCEALGYMRLAHNAGAIDATFRRK